MQVAHCFLLPSRVALDGDSEGCPVAVQEAQVAGFPVVSTRHVGIPEVVHDGVTAFLAKEGDVHPLAHGMERLLCNPNETARMGLAASAFARRRFTLHHHVAAVIAAVHGPVEQQESNARICFLRCTNVMLLAIVLPNFLMEELGMQLHRLVVARSLAQVKCRLG